MRVFIREIKSIFLKEIKEKHLYAYNFQVQNMFNVTKLEILVDNGIENNEVVFIKYIFALNFPKS